MKIGLFGGSFDPPHLGHLMVATTVVAQRMVDEVWFVPCANHPFAKNLSPAIHRIEMVKLLESHHKIYPYETGKKSPSYSFETLSHAKQEFPQHQFTWLMGSDQLALFSKWHKYQNILNEFGVLVYPRENHPLENTEHLLPGMIPLHNCPIITVSSTQIRNAVQENMPTKNLEYLIPKKIAEYIEATHLYR